MGAWVPVPISSVIASGARPSASRRASSGATASAGSGRVLSLMTTTDERAPAKFASRTSPSGESSANSTSRAGSGGAGASLGAMISTG